ncbi:MAG: UDP-N-acetylglucosamine 1-carboxyvinyltransferase [candidate division BRC1 bacterium ADurb.BinA364]|nr:MAG: UDP-N-acetylglucosamine 1-carboxyvinyltransferase [candidate division BRC1 bacterium ADurb.BinA364]
MDRFVIEGGHALRGEVAVSGSKNATLPIMTAALLAETPSVIYNVPRLRDIDMMAAVLRELGAAVEMEGATLRIDPAGFCGTEAPYDIVRKMRASVYVLAPMLVRLGKARVSLPGGCAIGPRPVDLHLKGLEGLGADVKLEHGYIVAENRAMKGGEMALTGPSGSSVGATANTMMAAALTPGTTIIRGAAHEPEIVDLAEFLKKMGANIEGEGSSKIKIEGVQKLRGVEHSVVPDRIEAGTFFAAAAITEGDVVVHGARVEHMDAVIDKLGEMGIYVAAENGSVRVACDGPPRPSPIRTLPYPGFPTDMQAQFMALLCLADGVSTVTETIYVERFIHAPELARMGARITVSNGQALIEGVPKLSGAPVMASDLRASAALVVAGLAAEGITDLHRVYHIDRGYEQIEQKLAALGANIRRVSSQRNGMAPGA